MGTLGKMIQEYRNVKADNLARAGHAKVVRAHEKADEKARAGRAAVVKAEARTQAVRKQMERRARSYWSLK